MTKAMTGGLSLGSAKAVADREDEGQVIELLDASGEPLVYNDGASEKPVTVTVAGTYSATYRKAVERQNRNSMKGRRSRSTSEELVESLIELEAACVLAWDGMTTDEGKPIDFTPENVARFLRGIPWFRNQVRYAMDDHASFFGTA